MTLYQTIRQGAVKKTVSQRRPTMPRHRQILYQGEDVHSQRRRSSPLRLRDGHSEGTLDVHLPCGSATHSFSNSTTERDATIHQWSATQVFLLASLFCVPCVGGASFWWTGRPIRNALSLYGGGVQGDDDCLPADDLAEYELESIVQRRRMGASPPYAPLLAKGGGERLRTVDERVVIAVGHGFSAAFGVTLLVKLLCR